MNTFTGDLKRGKQVEEIVLSVVRRTYPSATIINGKFKEYDIWIPEISKSIEVKGDQKSMYTGNFVVEIEMFNKPSGLLTTKADYWVFYDGEELIWMTPIKLIELIMLRSLRWASFVGKGDTHPKKAYLIPKDIIQNNALKVNKV